jgi:hypothetical protein
MGRYKKHKTKQAQRDRKREKSLKYYYNHRDDILKKKRNKISESDISEWIEPDKVTLSFVWFCFSKMSDEQLGERIIQFKEDFKKMFRKTLQQKHQDQLKSPDEEVKQKVEKDIEVEVEKNQNRVVDDLIQQLKLKPEDWKEKLHLDGYVGYN